MIKREIYRIKQNKKSIFKVHTPFLITKGKKNYNYELKSQPILSTISQ